MLTRRHAVLGAAAALLPASFAARAQGSDKPLKLIVPYPPGGSSDTIARLISQPLSEALKQTVVIENRAGANGNLGADAVAKAAPDGNTLLLCDVGALAISASVYTKLAFDPARALRGVTMLAYSPQALPASLLSPLAPCSAPCEGQTERNLLQTRRELYPPSARILPWGCSWPALRATVPPSPTLL